MIPLLPFHGLARNGDGLDSRLVAALGDRQAPSAAASNLVELDSYRAVREWRSGPVPCGRHEGPLPAGVDDLAAARARRAAGVSR